MGSSLGAECGKIIVQAGWDGTGRETDALGAREVEGGKDRCTTSGGGLGTPDESIFFADVLSPPSSSLPPERPL
jgi:hypothetical protein